MARILFLLLLIGPFVHAQDDGWDDDDWGAEDEASLQWTGFVEGGLGSRWDTDPQTGSKGTLREVRVRVETEWANDFLAVGFKGDALYDDIIEEFEVDIRDLMIAQHAIQNDLELYS